MIDYYLRHEAVPFDCHYRRLAQPPSTNHAKQIYSQVIKRCCRVYIFDASQMHEADIGAEIRHDISETKIGDDARPKKRRQIPMILECWHPLPPKSHTITSISPHRIRRLSKGLTLPVRLGKNAQMLFYCDLMGRIYAFVICAENARSHSRGLKKLH